MSFEVEADYFVYLGPRELKKDKARDEGDGLF